MNLHGDMPKHANSAGGKRSSMRHCRGDVTELTLLVENHSLPNISYGWTARNANDQRRAAEGRKIAHLLSLTFVRRHHSCWVCELAKISNTPEARNVSLADESLKRCWTEWQDVKCALCSGVTTMKGSYGNICQSYQ